MKALQRELRPKKKEEKKCLKWYRKRNNRWLVWLWLMVRQRRLPRKHPRKAIWQKIECSGSLGDIRSRSVGRNRTWLHKKIFVESIRQSPSCYGPENNKTIQLTHHIVATTPRNPQLIVSNQDEVKMEFDRNNMPFRRFDPSGLRVPVFSSFLP